MTRIIFPLAFAALSILSTFITINAATYHEVLNYEISKTPLPFPVSDLTATYSLAPNDDGDLIYAIYLLGGCIASYVTKPSSPLEYICPVVSDENIVFDPDTGLYEKRRSMPRARYRHSSSAVGGMIWVVGGRDGDDNLVEEVDVYDPLHDTWTTVGKLPPNYAVSDHAAFVLGEYLLIAGGYDINYLASSSTFVIDPFASLDENTLKLKQLAPLVEARGDARSVTYGQYGYIIGGFTHINGYCEPLQSMEIYDPKRDRWRTAVAGALNVGRADVALIEYQGKFFALGGETRQFNCTSVVDGENKGPPPRSKTYPVHSVEVYNPSDGLGGKWTIIHGGAPSNGQQMRFVVAPWPSTESIYAFGGIMYDAKRSDNGGCKEGDVGGECIELSNNMVIYTDAMEPDINPLAVIGGLIALILAAFAMSFTTIRLKKKEKPATYESEESNFCDDDSGGDVALVGISA